MVVKVKDLTGCSWYYDSSYITFFENGSFYDYTWYSGWTYLYKGTYSIVKDNDGFYYLKATYTAAYQNGYREELKDKCPYDGEPLLVKGENWLEIGSKDFKKTDFNYPTDDYFKTETYGNYPTAESMLGTTWYGSTAYEGYSVEIYIKDSSTCNVKVMYNGNVAEQLDCSYTYDEDAGSLMCSYGDGIYGVVMGDSMTLTDTYGTYTLKKK